MRDDVNLPLRPQRFPPPASNDDAPAPRIARRLAAMRLGDGVTTCLTLRLDPERHMRLRMACAVEDRGAEAILRHALDDYLANPAGVDHPAPGPATTAPAGAEGQTA